MSNPATYYISIVRKASDLGQRLAKFTPMGLQSLASEFERCFKVSVDIDEPDEPTVYDNVRFDFPRFEVSFVVKRLAHLHEFEGLAFAVRNPGTVTT